MTTESQIIKTELEYIWNNYRLAFVAHKAGWILEDVANDANIGYWRLKSLNRLVLVRGAKAKPIKTHSKWRKPANRGLTSYGLYVYQNQKTIAASETEWNTYKRAYSGD